MDSFVPFGTGFEKHAYLTEERAREIYPDDIVWKQSDCVLGWQSFPSGDILILSTFSH